MPMYTHTKHDIKGAMMIQTLKTPHCIALGIENETEQAKVVILIQFIDFFLCVHTNFYYSKCIWYLH